MIINNLNTLQNLSYTGTPSDLQSYTDIYLKQSLANLGQRFSIRGDGVTNGSFHLYELMPLLPEPAEDDFNEGGRLYNAYMVGTVKREDDNVEITLSAYLDDSGEPIATAYLSANDYVITDDNIYAYGAKVQSCVTGLPIAYYGAGSLISMPDDKTLKSAAQSLSEGYELLDISFNNYDEERARINDAVRIVEYEGETKLVFLSYDYASSSKVLHYNVTEYTINDNSVEGLWEDIMSGENSPVMSGDNKYTWTGQSVVDSLEGLIDEIATYHATWNSITRNLECDSDMGSNDFIEANILQWNESCDKELPLFRSIYNNNVYFSTDDNIQLKKRLVGKVFLELYKNWLAESDATGIEDTPFNIVAPYEYEFIYTCNSVNPAQIYSASRSVTQESTKNLFAELWKVRATGNQGVREQLLICPSANVNDTAEDIYSVWNYYVTYDNDDIVNDITVIRMYVMPYINDDGYWNINNVDTSIYARGKDGGQPSIIISYSDIERGEHEILSSMNDYELENVLDWDVAYYRARPLDTSTSIGAGSFHMMRTYMPTNISTAYIADNLVTFLENAIIMDIASVRNEDFSQSTTTSPLSDPTELGENATVTTFWALTKDEETKQYQFSYVKQPSSSWAVDFNYLTDAEAIIRYYMQLGMQPDKYRHSWLVYDEVSARLKNQGETDNVDSAFPVLMNRQADSMGDMFSIEGGEGGDNYLNNLNFMLGFYNRVEFNGSYISNVPDSNDGHFFGFNDEGHINVVPSWLIPDNEMSYDYYPNAVFNEDTGNTLIPTLDLKETFIRNVNVLNRYNILTPDAEGNVFYSYIGGMYADGDKSILHIGTSNEDINLGLKTLTTEEERRKFKPQHEIDIDFATIVLNGDVVIPKSVWVKMSQEGHPEHVMYSTLYELAYIFSEMPEPFDSIDEVTDEKMFAVKQQVSNDINDIGNGTSVQGKVTNVSYVSLTWFVNNILRLDGDSLSIIGEPGRLFERTVDEDVTYFLKLTTDILDDAERAYEENGAYYVKTNALSISYAQTNDDIVHLNIRENVSTHSTAYAIYDGGELQ